MLFPTALIVTSYLGLRRLCAEFGRGLRVPRLGPLLSTIGATKGIPEGS